MDAHISDWISKTMKLVAELLYNWSSGVPILAKRRQFKHATEEWAALKKVSAAVLRHFRDLKHIELSCGRVSIRDELKKAEQCIKSELDNIVARYKGMQLKNLVEDCPEDLFARLKEAASSNSDIDLIKQDLWIVIKAKFKAELDHAREACDKDSDQLRSAKRAIETLPVNLRGQVQAMITDAESYIERQQQAAQQCASDLLSDQIDVDNIMCWCQQNHTKAQHRAGMRHIEEHLLTRARRCKAGAENLAVGQKLPDVIRDINLLFEWAPLDLYAPKLAQIRSDVAGVVRRILSGWLDQLHTLFESYNPSLTARFPPDTNGWARVHPVICAVVQLLPLLEFVRCHASDMASSSPPGDGPSSTEAAAAADVAGAGASQDCFTIDQGLAKFEESFKGCCEHVDMLLTKGLEAVDIEVLTFAITVATRLDTVETATEGGEGVSLGQTVERYCQLRAGTLAPPERQQLAAAAEKVQLHLKQKQVMAWIEQRMATVNKAELINNETTGVSSSKKTQADFYIHVNDALNCITKLVPQLPKTATKDPIALALRANEVTRTFSNKVEALFALAKERTESDGVSGKQLAELGDWMDNLAAIGRCVTSLGDSVTKVPGSALQMLDCLSERLRKKFTTKLHLAVQRINNSDGSSDAFADAAELLIQVKTIGDAVKPLREEIRGALDVQLRRIKRQKGGGAANIDRLHDLLESNSDPVGQLIVEEHPVFKGGNILRFNQRCQDVGYVLRHIRAAPPSLDVDALLSAHDDIMNMWQSVVKQNLSHGADLGASLAPVVATIKQLRRSIGTLETDSKGRIKWRTEVRKKVPALLANLFALWTLSCPENYVDTEGLDQASREKCLMAPHAGQVVALLCMFGIGVVTRSAGRAVGVLHNNLVQLNTGEGKSVVIAMAAAVLALLGCEVSCACYSSTLSRRDQASFRQLFQLINVEERVRYGTFDRLCEQVINACGEIRSMARNLILDSKKPEPATSAEGMVQVVIVDEVDVLFSREFYGQAYVPASLLTGETVTALVLDIWASRDQCHSVRDITNLASYKACVKQFGAWSQLIKEAVGEMLMDVKRYDTVGYVVRHDKIAYKQMDGLVYNKSYRYRTMFAYCYEHSVTGNITKEARDRHIGVTVRCGNFSYAEITSHFNCIIGVTGTLDSLSAHQLTIVKEPPFSIVQQTFMPTVFGASSLIFSPGSEISRDLFIQDRQHFPVALAQQIQERCYKGGDQSQPRAVLVFFADEEALLAAREAPAMASLRDHIAVVTEDLSDEEKRERVKRASYKHHITFITAAFGRGTDFLCRDTTVLHNGGVHVIQTFVADSLSEEVQVRGRTARQGQAGSYSLLLVQEELEQCGVDLAQLMATPFEPDHASITAASATTSSYGQLVSSGALGMRLKYISDCRNHAHDARYKEETAHIAELRAEHGLALQFLEKLRAGDSEHVRKFLVLHNTGPSMDVQSRTICLMDATGSMSKLLFKAKNTVKIVYARLCDLLAAGNYSPGVFEMQFAVYRNYNSPIEEILEVRSQPVPPLLSGSPPDRSAEMVTGHFSSATTPSLCSRKRFVLVIDRTKSDLLRRRRPRGPASPATWRRSWRPSPIGAGGTTRQWRLVCGTAATRCKRWVW